MPMQYHQYIPQKSKLTTYQVKERAKQFLTCKKLEELSALLKIEKHKLVLLSQNPAYDSFYLPKPKGGYRLIQAPKQPLKDWQDRIGRWLQYVYYALLPESSYGFVIVPADADPGRSIFTNAQRHIGQKWVLNIDLKSFFHHIHRPEIEKMFLAPPFGMSNKAAQTLGGICTLEGRLPMGAPSSPVLSNMMSRPMDAALQKLAQKSAWTYTRYADDLTFSSQKKMKANEIHLLTQQLRAFGFRINAKKMRLQHQSDPPEVTGLLLHKKRPDVSESYIDGIKNDLKILNALVDPRMIHRGIFDRKPVKKLHRSIRGQIQFVRMIRGAEDKVVHKLQKKLDKSAVYQHRR